MNMTDLRNEIIITQAQKTPEIAYSIKKFIKEFEVESFDDDIHILAGEDLTYLYEGGMSDLKDLIMKDIPCWSYEVRTTLEDDYDERMFKDALAESNLEEFALDNVEKWEKQLCLTECK